MIILEENPDTAWIVLLLPENSHVVLLIGFCREYDVLKIKEMTGKYF